MYLTEHFLQVIISFLKERQYLQQKESRNKQLHLYVISGQSYNKVCDFSWLPWIWTFWYFCNHFPVDESKNAFNSSKPEEEYL
jgi:hypothetical protein